MHPKLADPHAKLQAKRGIETTNLCENYSHFFFPFFFLRLPLLSIFNATYQLPFLRNIFHRLSLDMGYFYLAQTRKWQGEGFWKRWGSQVERGHP